MGTNMDAQQSARVRAVVVISGQILSVCVFVCAPLSGFGGGRGKIGKKMMSHICVYQSGFRGFYFNQNMMIV